MADHNQQKLVADQLIKEPLPESQIQTTSQEPSLSAPVDLPLRVHRTRNHAAIGEQLYKPGYKNAEKHADRSVGAKFMLTSTSSHTTTGSEDTARRSKDNNTFDKHEPIESADKEGVQRLFSKRTGTRTVQTDAFNLKSARMTFSEPPVPNVPKFVEQAMEEYNLAMTAYRLNQQELNRTAEKARENGAIQDSSTSSIPSSPPLTTTAMVAATQLPMPKPSPFIRQYSLRNLRHYPSTIDAPHPPYRVVYVISKKVVSKLAIHRNLCRKKLSAAVETVFREHARPGYEFMFFAKHQCITTSQKDLEEMLIKTLKDPNLYADTASRTRDRYATPANLIGAATTTAITTSVQPTLPSPSTTQGFEIAKKPTVKIRWKNNQPPLKWDWWKHALPNPLGRTHQSNEYLDMHCPKPQEGVSTRDSTEHENTISGESKK
ncbi:hypothetical protein BG015_009033 [Linnemannia schmuckeri]|uniref:Uncharacterized protein n=1 Tax=Linnemannia schmuckeri TaxID=64567 RepID=A0A9P5RY87_9FUNG|nr:hypothetical protein BG015_009033 [Linnemannia schmuckeri]